MRAGATVDLAYKYSADNKYTNDSVWIDGHGTDTPDDDTEYGSWPTDQGSTGQPARRLEIYNGKFGTDLTFRLNLGTKYSEKKEGVSSSEGYSDQILLHTPTLIDETAEAVSKIKVQYVINKSFGLGTGSNFGISSWEAATGSIYEGKVYSVFGFRESDTATMDKFLVTGEPDKTAIDGALNKYIIDSELKKDTSSATSNNYSVYWTAQKQDFLSQGAYSAANAALSMRNLWRIEDNLFWKRGEDVRFHQDTLRQTAPADTDAARYGEDGIWANMWRGKYDFAGIQGSGFGQNYNGIQVGIDKLRTRELFGGKVYTGVFVSKMNSDADFYAQNAGGANYNSGKGELESLGVGAYALWYGKNGHYLDTTLRWSRIENEYGYTDSFGEHYKQDFTGKTYGIAARYGRRIAKADGWFMEPQLGLSYGAMRPLNFTMGNGLKYDQDKVDMLIGRAGITFGKAVDKGQVYAKLAANHDFMDAGNAMMYAVQQSSGSILAAQSVDTLAGKDTWYEAAIGGNARFNDNTDGWVELSKTFGGEVDTKWQVNAGISWRWGGATKAEKEAYRQSLAGSSMSMGTAAAAKDAKIALPQQPKVANVTINSIASTNAVGTNTAAAVSDGGQNIDAVGSATDRQVSAAVADNSNRAANAAPADPGLEDYTLAPVTVEAKRPDWEKTLSPGTVSVIDVPKYAGEHKTFADLLQTVPGVYIDRLSGGTGHYTTVKVRGSSASQVNIYLDGVMVNTGSEQAVNLENINMDNVERIEVYRGYIPARFAGAAMGGAINVVTKRPGKAGGKASFGMRSFNGYKENLEVTAPLGSGSMLLAANRDQAKGDFGYTKVPNDRTVTVGNSDGSQSVYEFPAEHWRRHNGYQNNNVLFKWQDKNWFAKVNYTRNKTHTPQSAAGDYADVPDDLLVPGYSSPGSQGIRAGIIDTEKTELSFGRRQQTGNLEWGWKLSSAYQDKKALSHKLISSDLHVGENTFKNQTYEASIDGSWKMGEHHLLEFLGTASRETMKVGFTYRDQWSSSHVGGSDLSKLFIPEYKLRNYYLQLQDTMRLDSSGSLTFTPLVRAQKNEIGIDVNEGEGWLYSYNLSLKKQFNPSWTAWATYGTYYKTPSWYEIFGDGVNLMSRWFDRYDTKAPWTSDVYTERGKNWDVAVNWNGKALGAEHDVTLSYFHRNANNLMTTMFNPISGASWYANFGAGKIQGVELGSKTHWQRFDLSLSATWQDSEITKGYLPGANMSSATGIQGGAFPWTPKWELNARLDYRFPGDKLTLFGEYHWLDKLYRLGQGTGGVSGSDIYYEPLGTFNVGLKYNFDKRFKLVAGVNDIANKGPNQKQYYPSMRKPDSNGHSIYERNVSYPQQGRTYYMTMEYSF